MLFQLTANMPTYPTIKCTVRGLAIRAATGAIQRQNTTKVSCTPRSITQTLKIEKVIPAGAVPKFNAVSPDNRFALASNWCSWDLSVIDINKNVEIERVKLGAYPRGIVVTPDSKNAYVAIMGSSDIAKVNLIDFSVEWLRNIGNARVI